MDLYVCGIYRKKNYTGRLLEEELYHIELIDGFYYIKPMTRQPDMSLIRSQPKTSFRVQEFDLNLDDYVRVDAKFILE